MGKSHRADILTLLPGRILSCKYQNGNMYLLQPPKLESKPFSLKEKKQSKDFPHKEEGNFVL